MTKKLPHRPKPLPGECFEGFLLRISEANGYPSRRWITDLAGLETSAVSLTSDVGALAEWLEVPKAELDALRYPPSPWAGKRRMHLFHGQPIHRLALNLDRPRICPACLKDSPHHHMSWELATVALCIDHATQLIDACPKCGTALSWNRSHLCQCHHCGYDLRQAKPEPAQVNALRLTRQMLAAAHLSEGRNDGFPPELADLPLTTLVRLALLLGTIHLGLPTGTGHWPCVRLSAKKMTELLNAAATALSDWPNGFHAMLAERSNKDTPNQGGPDGIWKRLSDALYKDMTSPRLDFVRRALEDYASRHWSGGVLTGRNKRFRADHRRSNRFVSKAEACQKLHVRPDSIDEFLNTGVLKGIVRPSGQRHSYLIERAGLEESLQDLLETKEVYQRLNISPKCFRDLVDAGYLTPVTISTKPNARIRYRKQDVDDLLAAFMGDIPVVKDRTGLISMHGVLRRLSFHQLSLTDLVGEVLTATLTPSARAEGGTGLMAALFREEDILAMAQRYKVNRGDSLTIPEAALRIGIKQQVAYQLVREGLWPVIRAWENGRTIHLVNADTVASFKQRYVSASELALTVGTSPRSLVEAMNTHGVKPITGPGVDDGRQYFFRRSDAVQAARNTAFPFMEGVGF